MAYLPFRDHRCGRRIHLVRSMADALVYERINGHNRIQVMLLRDQGKEE